MNERIKELALQAGLPEYITREVGPTLIQKFSELIIADCYSVIIKSQRGHFNPATSWDAVKQHFGVKE
jgi:hypothetical protein